MPHFDIIENPPHIHNCHKRKARKVTKDNGRDGGGLITLFTKMNEDAIL
jgi:hypothetical protein